MEPDVQKNAASQMSDVLNQQNVEEIMRYAKKWKQWHITIIDWRYPYN